MKLKQMTAWSIKNNLKSYGVFFLIYAAVIIALCIFITVVAGKSEDSGSFNSGVGTIFLFVTGIVMFAMQLRVGLANGVSRRSVFGAYLVSTLTTSVVAALGEIVLLLPAHAILTGNGLTLMPMLFVGEYTADPFLSWILVFLISFTSGLMVMAMGLFIGGAYYRMGKLLKVLVSVGVPALILFGTPAMLYLMPSSWLQAISNNMVLPFIQFFFATPWNTMLLFLLITVVLLCLIWLLIRRAPAKAAAK